MNRTKTTAILFCWMAFSTLSAQTLEHTTRREERKERREEMKARVDSVMTARYFSGIYDTTYICRPIQPFMVKVHSNISGTVFDISQKGEQTGSGKLETDHNATLSLGLNWRGLSAGISLNPGRLSGRNKDYELNLNAYMNRYGVDVIYQDARTLSGNVTWGDQPGHVDKDWLRMRALNINGYYAFNHRHFSYPAAFAQSYIQRRSAGSWLVGFSYMGGKLETTEQRPADMPTYRVWVGHLGVGGGYGYNWVTCRGHLLMHLSALPTVVIGNYSNIRVDDERRDMHTTFPDLILAERAAVVYNFNDKYFAAATFVVTHSMIGGDDVDIDFTKWRARTCLGIRLWGKDK